MDAGSNDIPSDQFPLGSSTGGLVCVQDYQTASTFFSAGNQTTSRGSGCIKEDMDVV